MFGPGAYRPDPTEGMTAIADLPPPELVLSSRTYTRQACPRCGPQAYRDKQYQRTLHDLTSTCGVRVVSWSPIRSTTVRSVASTLMQTSQISPHPVVSTPPRDGLGGAAGGRGWLAYRPASWPLWRDHRVFVPFATIQNWVEAGGKKGAGAHGYGLSRLGIG